MVAGTGTWAISVWVSQAIQWKTELEVKQVGYKQIPMWNASIAGGGFTHFTIMPVCILNCRTYLQTDKEVSVVGQEGISAHVWERRRQEAVQDIQRNIGMWGRWCVGCCTLVGHGKNLTSLRDMGSFRRFLQRRAIRSDLSFR